MAAGRLTGGGRRKIGATDYCVRCGKPYIITAPAQSYCPACAPTKTKEDRSLYVRASAGNEPRRLGTTDVCARCGAVYTLTGGNQKYCPACAKALLIKKASRHLGDTAICEKCGGEYTIAAGNQRFCPECSCAASVKKRRAATQPKRRKPRPAPRKVPVSVPAGLRELLDLYEVPQSRFSTFIGVDATIVNRWCTGVRKCPAYVLTMAAKILSLAADEIRGEAENDEIDEIKEEST